MEVFLLQEIHRNCVISLESIKVFSMSELLGDFSDGWPMFVPE